MATAKSAEEWPSITRDERIRHEILFYSQGPFDGYLIGEKARDLFLHSRLPLTVLSQIWNLADVSNDNLLNAEEFVLVMHLIQGVLRGKKVPRILPHNLKPKHAPTAQLPPLSDAEKEAYVKVFQTCNTARTGFFEATEAKDILQASELPSERLADVWDLSDVNRDGKLDVEEWIVACQLVRLLKQGHNLEGSVNSFTYVPSRIAPTSLQARKLRVDEYDRHKQRLMLIKEKRKTQAVQETRRLQLLKEKSSLEKELCDRLKRLGKCPVEEAEVNKLTEHNTKEVDKLEEIVARLKKEHEKIRQETVKVILGEQKLHGELAIIKSETSEINKRLATLHSKATKDADPFHQLYEQRKEERKKSNLSEGEEPEIHLPFNISPFDKEKIESVISGTDIFINSNNNHSKRSKENQSVLEGLHEFGDKFLELWSSPQSKGGSSKSSVMENEEDTVFMTITEDADVEWTSSDKVPIEEKEILVLHKKLVDLKNEMKKLNKDAGGKLIFRNPSDYLARKKAKEEEEQDKPRHPRRSKSSADTDYVNKRRSYVERKNDEASEAIAREKRANRRSLNLDHKLSSAVEGQPSPRKPAPERPLRLPVRTQSTEKDAPAKARHSDKTSSPTTSPTRSTKKHRAPPPPCPSALPDSKKVESNPPVVRKELSPERPPRRKSRHSSNSPRSTSSAPLKEEKPCDKDTTVVQEEAVVAASKSDVHSNPALVNGDIVLSVKTDSDIVVPKERIPNVDKTVNLTCDSEINQTSVKGSGKNQQNSGIEHKVNLIDTTESVKSDIKAKPSHSINGNYNLGKFQEDPAVELEEPSVEVRYKAFPEPDDTSVIEELHIPVKVSRRAAPDNISLAESVQSETDSIPPELPVSPPPILPPGGLPIDNPAEEEEVIEVVTSPVIENVPLVPSVDEEVIHITKSSQIESQPPIFTEEEEEIFEEEIIEVVTTTRENQPPSISVEPKERVTSPTVSDLRAQFFGITKSPPPKMESSLIDEPVPQTNGSIDVYFNDLSIEAKLHAQKHEDIDSDLSDTEQENTGFQQTFTPGEANGGHIPISISDDNEAEDGGIQLISFNTTANSSMLQSPGEQSQTDSAFDEMMSSMHSNDLDRDISNHVSLSNTLDDSSDDQVVVVTETYEVETVNEVETLPQMNDYEDEELESEMIIKPDETENLLEEADDVDVNVIQVDEQEHILTAQMIEVDVDMPTESAPPPPATSPDNLILVNDDDEDYEVPMTSPPETPRPTNDRSISPSQDTPRGTRPRTMSPPSGPRDTYTIVQKARQFSDIINEPPKVTIKASTKEVSEERLQQMDKERKAIIQQSMKNASFDGIESSSEDDEAKDEVQKEDSDDNIKSGPTIGVTSGESWTNKSSDAEDKKTEIAPPKIKVSTNVNLDDKPAKVDLLSHNVIQEPETTESVDRDSIANLGTTRQQWETRFNTTPHNAGVPKPKPPAQKSTVRHWEVKLPYKPSPSFRKQEDTMEEVVKENGKEGAVESAIDREIRLANEREEMLRKEQEERRELTQRQEASKQNIQKMNFEKQNNNNNDFKTMYHEMTEADRGSEMQKREIIIKQEIDEQQERENAIRNGKDASEESDSNEEPENVTESVIAREIRLQQEREMEIASRHQSKSSDTASSSVPQNQTETKPPPEISYEEAIGTYQHQGESLIARELREAKERDEELRKMRQNLSNVKGSGEKPVAKQAPVAKQPTTQKTTEPVRKLSQNISPSVQAKTSSQPPVRKVAPIPDSGYDEEGGEEDEKDKNVQQHETPIMREIRLARERENELRRQKGLPEIVDKKAKNTSGYKSAESSDDSPRSYNRQKSEKSTSMKQYASSRLQNEILKQKERELSLRQEGKIISTSEDHIEPLKYVEIASDVPVKRNFVTRKSVTTISDAEKTPSEHSDSDSLKDMPVNHITPQPIQSQEEPKFRRSFATGGPSFSYRESSQKAESKIEKELREMKEREDELRKQRADAIAESKSKVSAK